MRNSKKLAAAAFIVSLSLVTVAPTTLNAATNQSRTADPGPGGFLRRLLSELRHALGFSTNGEDIISIPKP
jgi:hypothetical protein